MMLNGFARRRGITFAAGALVVALAACGSQPNSVTVKKAVSPQKVVLASVQATTAAKSARIAMSVSTNGTGYENFALTADGVSDFATGDAAITMSFTGSAAKLLRGDIEVRTVDGVGYVKMPESLGAVLGAGKWLKTPDLSGASSVVPGLGQSDPTKFLAYLETVSSGVKKVGTESIRGVETTHYAATLDLGKAVDQSHVPASLKRELGKLVQKDGSSVKLPADVWVDNDGLTRRIQLKLDLGAIAGAGNVPAVTTSIDLYDFGVPVHVVAPPASDVTDLKDLGLNSGGTFGSLGTTTTLGAPA